MKIHQLRCFVAVYEEGSLTAAALRTNATQSGLSMQLKELEERHGVSLMQRNSRGMTPTNAGHRFYASAVRILNAIATAEQDLQQLKGSLAGSVRAGLMPTFTRSVLGSALKTFIERHPIVRVLVLEAYSPQLVEKVMNDKLDFAIVPGFQTHPALRTSPMSSDREFLVTARGRLAENLSPVRLRDLEPLRLVLPSPENARRSRIDAYLAAQGVEIDSIIEIDSMFGTLSLVEQTDWMTILPSILCAADKDGMRRHLHPIEDPPLTVDYVIVQRRVGLLPEGATAFIQCLHDELDTLINWHERWSPGDLPIFANHGA